MESYQLDELKEHTLVSLEDYKDYPVDITNMLSLNADKTVAMLPDNTYVFKVKDSLLKLGFIKNNQVTFYTFAELYFMEDLEGAEDILNRVLSLNKFKIKEGHADKTGFSTIFSREINGKTIIVKLTHKKNLGSTVSIILLNKNIPELSIEFPRFSGVESIEKLYDCSQNMLGVNLNCGIDVTSYSIKDSVVEQHLARICELQEELSDEEFLTILEEHPEYVEAYQRNCFSRELTRKILRSFATAVEYKREQLYKVQHNSMVSKIRELEQELYNAKYDLKEFEGGTGLHKSIDELDL